MNSQWCVDCVKQAARWTCIALLLLAAGTQAVYADGPPPPAGVPELDPAAIASAMMLFTGGLLMIQARRK